MKIFLWTLGSIVTLFLLLVIAFQIPAFQNFAKNRVVSYLEGKIHTKVVINHVEIGLPKKIILEGVYFEDQQKDTLLAGEKLAVDISLFELLNNKVELNSVDLQGITAHLSRNKNGEYNYDYIVKAFASEEGKKDATPMEFSLDKVNFDRVKFKYTDAYENNDLAFYVNHFDTNIKTFDIQQMAFEVKKTTINGLHLKLRQGIVETVQEIKDVVKEKQDEENKILKLKLGEFDLSKIDIDFEDAQSKLITKIDVEKLAVVFKTLDIAKGNLILDKLNASNTKAKLELGKLERQLLKSDITTVSPVDNWKVSINEIKLQNVDFKFDDFNYAVEQGVDYRHFDLKKINLDAQDLRYAVTKSSGSINSFSVNDTKSGLVVQELTTDFNYTDHGAFLKNLHVKTPQSQLKKDIVVGYPSVSSLRKNPGELSVMADVSNSKVGFKDILLLAPQLKRTPPFSTYPNAIVSINSIVRGKLKNLSFPKLEVSGIGTTKISASGRIVGLPNINTAYFDLNIKNAQAGSKDIYQFVPRGTIPNSIQLPSQMAAKGTFKGTLHNFNTNMNIASSFGNAKVKGRFDNRIKNKERYDAHTELDNFNLGKLIKNDSIGKVSLVADVKGVGLNPKTANATVDGTVLKFGFHNYTYTDLDINGKINNGLFNVKADTQDPNLTFTLAADGSFRDKYPSGKLKLNLDIADLDKLHLHAGPMKMRGEIVADIQSADLDYLNGTVTAKNFIIANQNDQFPIDSISITATSTAEKNSLLVKSQFVDVNVEGKYKLSKVADAVEYSVAKYYDFNTRYKKTKVEDQRFVYNVKVKDNKILVKFIPKLKSIDPIIISGRYNSVNDTIILNGSISKLIYDDNTITGLTATIDTRENGLTYNIAAGNLKKGNFELAYSSLSGTIANNTINYNLLLKDLGNKDRYQMAGTLKSVNGDHEFHLNPDNLVLNYEPWKASNENVIRFGRTGVHVDDFELSQAGKYIRINSLGAEPNSPINVNFIDFDIETITNIAQKSNWQMSGKINGNAVFRNLDTTPVFTSDLVVSDFTFQKELVGRVEIKMNNETTNRYAAEIKLNDNGNLVSLNGYYSPADSSLDMNLDITQLQVKSIQGFTYGRIKDGVGFWSGNLKVNGKIENPIIVGDLKFNQVGFTVTELNSKLQGMNDKIAFTPNIITFNRFIIKDEQNNDLTIDGRVNSEDYTNLGFDLKLYADNFKAVNSKEKDNDQFYGELYLDNNLHLKGDWNSPYVDGTIRVNKDTKFFFVLPQEDPSIADREGIVEFIDQDQPKLFATITPEEILSQTKIKGINASVNIIVDKEAEISLVIDKATGDFLRLKGEAQLTGGIDPSGKTTLTGRYELDEGSYEMSFNLIKRRFDIKKGSYILWTGEPTTADINVTAVYKVETAPINLLNEQLSNLTPEERNTYKQRIPFEAELKMTGELMRPDIKFDILLPEGNNTVSSDIIDATKTKLSQLRQDPDELNKQVFALLLLNRFIGENPFTSETGGISASSFARNSASKILSQQLNNLAADLIEGFELDFDLNSYEDYTTGEKNERTDLNVGVSKRLLDDRLKVTVGSSFGIEGERLENQQSNNIAGDISAEYQLSKDGRYRIRAYRKNKYQVALQGQVIETGVGFIITIDYNEFKEIFQRRKKEASKNE